MIITIDPDGAKCILTFGHTDRIVHKLYVMLNFRSHFTGLPILSSWNQRNWTNYSRCIWSTKATSSEFGKWSTTERWWRRYWGIVSQTQNKHTKQFKQTNKNTYENQPHHPIQKHTTHKQNGFTATTFHYHLTKWKERKKQNKKLNSNRECKTIHHHPIKSSRQSSILKWMFDIQVNDFTWNRTQPAT